MADEVDKPAPAIAARWGGDFCYQMVDLFAGKTDSSNRFAALFVAQCVHDVCAGKLGKVNFKRASRCF